MGEDERPATPSTDARGAIDLAKVREIVAFLTRVPAYWVVIAAVAALLSCVTISRNPGGGVGLKFSVSMTAVALLAVAWIPAALRTLAVVVRNFRAFGVEFSSAGLDEFFRSHEPADATLTSAGGQGDALPEPTADHFEEVPESAYVPAAPEPALPAWASIRGQIYQDNQDLFLVHSIKPSRRQNQTYDVFVYLAGSHGVQPADVVDTAEFYLGEYWGNRIFSVRNPETGATIGLRTSAYGPALCICRVTFKRAGYAPVILHRFLDFEMGWVFAAASEPSASSAAA